MPLFVVVCHFTRSCRAIATPLGPAAVARTSAATLHATAAVSTAVTAIMDSSSVLIEEQKLQTEPKYRAYMANIDKALKNFEYSSEWADLISALGKLNKVSLL